jgi:putative chitinase
MCGDTGKTNNAPAISEGMGTPKPKIYGMIDGNACINSAYTLPMTCGYIDNGGTFRVIPRMVIDNNLKGVIKKDDHRTTTGVGNALVGLNTKMYNGKMLKLPDKKIDEKNIPSFVIASTMDTELAHLDGYSGIFIKRDISPTESWVDQIKKADEATLANPLRLFPLFSYDPRRYRWPVGYHPAQRYPRPDLDGLVGEEGCGSWKEPFAHIIGHDRTDSEIKKIWIGFCMNPFLGFRPFDELCKYIPEFYKECEGAGIPILANCALNGVVTHEANVRGYREFNRKALTVRLKKMEERGKKYCTGHYYGKERVVDDNKLDYFYRNYGHPKNWVPVLEHCPKLRLCLAGFGGNSEWQRKEIREWATVTPGNSDGVKSLPREWIRCIIRLTAKYKNVYADVSGLNIDNPDIKSGLQKMLRLIHNGHPDFEHLKYKLIFGSDWYFAGRDYGDYCSNVKELFCDIDGKGNSWELWERISLINPLVFYALYDNSKNKVKIDKIEKIHDVLKKNTRGNAKAMLEKMKNVLHENGELVRYVSSHSVDMKTNDSKDSKYQNVKDDNDLINGGIRELITLEELYEINKKRNLENCKYYIDALNEVLPQYEINTSRRLAHFLAQVLHESALLEKNNESFHYQKEDRLIKIFGKYFSKNGGETTHTTSNGKPITLKKPKRKAADYCVMNKDTTEKQQMKYENIANYVYANRIGNGQESGGDGYKFRGRGLIQLTGLANYKKFGISHIGKKLGLTWGGNGINLQADPDLVIKDAITIVHSACWFWDTNMYREKKLNELADNDNIDDITQAINGGLYGLDDRKNILKNAKKVLDIQ